MKTPQKFQKAQKVTWSEGSHPSYRIHQAIDSGNGFFRYELKSPDGTICGPAREDELTASSMVGEQIAINTQSVHLVWFGIVEKETEKALLIACVAYTISAYSTDSYGSALGRAWFPKRWLKNVSRHTDMLDFQLNKFGSDKINFFNKAEVAETHAKEMAQLHKLKSQLK